MTTAQPSLPGLPARDREQSEMLREWGWHEGTGPGIAGRKENMLGRSDTDKKGGDTEC